MLCVSANVPYSCATRATVISNETHTTVRMQISEPFFQREGKDAYDKEKIYSTNFY